MPANHEQFHSVNTHRRILVADDELINREMLAMILQQEYEVLFACDGGEAMDVILENQDTLSLILMDILMPVKSGLDILRELKADPLLAHIPVIVTTSERETEIESLNLGAIDFIPKPYPDPGIILARVLRTIELSEDRDIIQSTERDELTGLYNPEYFYRYAEQYDQFHRDQKTDAVLLDVNHFHMLNERHGRAYGDTVLKTIGRSLQEAVHKDGGIVCRREADTFMIYSPHREDYDRIMKLVSDALLQESGTGNKVHLRIGVYSETDRDIDIERRFDRAKIAADTIKGSFSQIIAYYDRQMHERELYAEQLIEAFPAAIENRQFQVYYQPKFDIRPDTPVLASAEALVRWIHPDLGMISPGVFIPLFEENGLIRELDTYVWNEAARQIRDWKDRLLYAVPVSVNVSRIDMYDPELPETLTGILKKYDLSGKDLLLEVTESAYTQDARQIINTVKNLQSLGFHIEMDDFGTGYSSLNMISDLPIDTLKLDMQFIRGAFREGGNAHMLEVIIGIAGYLSVPVVAEGVETEEQLHALKALGCDLVQGYFFSRPVPAGEFEPFILQKKEADLVQEQKSAEQETSASEKDENDFRTRLDEMRKKAEQLGTRTQKSSEPDVQEYKPGIQLRTASVFFFLLALLVSLALIVCDFAVTQGYQRMAAASDRYISSQLAASDMVSGSDYLTDRVRCFVVTGRLEYLDDFVEEVNVTRRRDLAVENLEELLRDDESSTNTTALKNLSTALELSNELVEIENKAMRLMLETDDYDLSGIPQEILDVQLTPEELALSTEEQKTMAQNLVFNANYMHYKDRIRENVSLCTQALIRGASQDLENASSRLSLLVHIQTLVSLVYLLIVLGVVVLITQLIRKPLTRMVSKMQAQEMVPPAGVEELRFVTRTYNQILVENQKAREKLSHEASHDALTGLFNRGAYDLLLESTDTEHMALILIDVDYFKSVNDTYGHAVGDRVLKRVAEILRHSFRSVDILCRIGGDEFAVVMTRANSSMRQLVLNKINRANELLQHPKDDLPPVSLSVGVAFSDRKSPQGDIFKDADTALYEVKKTGRNGCVIY